jgi:hypothetical protein
MKTERRYRRSQLTHEALTLFLEAARKKAGLEAVALTTRDGLLVGGAGEHPDLEWMGALGASSGRSSLRWEGTTLHVEPVQLPDVELCLTSAGRPLPAATLREGLARILAWSHGPGPALT